MRLLLASTAVALLFGLSPASAMCGGGGQQAGMCGAPAASKSMSERVAKDWPAAPSQAQPEQKSGTGMGGCPCCKNMAMMMDGMKSDDPHKGMDMPKQ
ncbi:hypothetical protein IVB22_05835 [Bradyrhizobium sp. 190]|uniref:hypothetical protein n=1 Tax=Bradyrhizobium sp. 190 TaxID=2782658 RepID=UPI001FFA5B11|nr:hypothetical protein [Bradyrhizobium sp. 190]MCK1512096.1 hypothetical protein [Bradyrhizobium sp. 190]